jgi:molybdopterin/thiamine biosynthesis adenylyltransferase
MQNSYKTEKVLSQPKIFDFSDPLEKAAFGEIKTALKPDILNTLNSQLSDLATCMFPAEIRAGTRPEELVSKICKGLEPEALSNLVYYPWKNTAVWVLKEENFILARTNRNKVKITAEEQVALSQKHVLFVGLSVGQSSALTFAMQRACGHLHLADFDELSLSNMNRLRASVVDIGLPKTAVAARQISEQDPYLKVYCHNTGATAENIDNLITRNGQGKIDLIVEECDSLEIKILIRQRARFFGVPVIMDTSDRGMMDIERFDLEKNLPIFHGLISEEEIASANGKLTPEQRFGLLQKIVNIEGVSEGMKLSLALIGKNLHTWPQLASEVTLGGALTTYVGYKILTGKNMESGRIYVDLEEIFKTRT